jgi:triacylglycerol lipase
LGTYPETNGKNGVKVYYGGTDAWGTIENNAQKIKEKIEAIVKKDGVEKFNVIAHSRGGLEARYLISSLKLSSIDCVIDNNINASPGRKSHECCFRNKQRFI